MPPIIIEGPKIPYVKKSAAADDAVDVKNNKLPRGVELTGGSKMYKKGLTGKGVRVAVIDSGVDDAHSGFGGKVTKQTWFRYGTDLSEDDHGTHVAGTIHMLAPDAEIHDYRVFGAEGDVDVVDAISASIYQACIDGCDVINMSLGNSYPIASIKTAVQYAHSKGVIIVCAAGNEGDGNPMTNEIGYPAVWDETISVAAVSKERDLPVAYWSSSNPQVDYAGIGVDVVSFKPGGGNQEMSGTSMACPHVCGLIAALLDEDKGYNNASCRSCRCTGTRSILDRLKKMAIDIGVKGPDNETGLGFLTFLTKKEFNATWSSEEEALSEKTTKKPPKTEVAVAY